MARIAPSSETMASGCETTACTSPSHEMAGARGVFRHSHLNIDRSHHCKKDIFVYISVGTVLRSCTSAMPWSR